jgi:hypothetical protein
MATTSKGIYYPTSSDNIAPLESHFAGLASSVDSALNKTKSGVTPTFTGPAAVGSSVSPTTITFPTAFATSPAISATLFGGSSAVEAYTVVIHSVSTTGFTAKVFKTNGTSTAETGLRVHWIAMEA